MQSIIEKTERETLPEGAMICEPEQKETIPSNMKVLVIGGAGWFGEKLVPYLEQNFDVDVYDLKNGDDLFDQRKLAGRMKNVDAVIHLAAIPHFDRDKNWEDFEKLNVDGTRVVLDHSRRQNKRLIYFSSGAIYGFDGGFLSPPGETLPVLWHGDLNEVNLYAKSKILAERLIMATAEEDAPKAQPFLADLDNLPSEDPAPRIILRPNWPGGCVSGELLEAHWGAEVEWDLLLEITFRSIVTNLKGVHVFNAINTFQRNGQPSRVDVSNRIAALGI